MKLNPIARLFKGGEKPATRLMAVTPPRTGERTLLGVENLLGSIAVPEPFSLEIAGDSGGVTLLARCREGSFVRQQLGVHYPQARVNEVIAEDDPLRLREGEQAWSMDLRLRGPEYLPLRTFRDDDLLDQGSDPLISVIGSLSDLEEGERVVSRIKLASLGPDWSSQHLEKTNPRPAYDPNTSPATAQARIDRTNAGTLTVLALLALPALRAYFWIQSGETWKAVLLGLGVASLAAFAGWAWWRIKKARSGGRYQDPLLIKEKVSRTAYEAQVEVTAILSEHGVESRARELLRNVASAYKHYDNPAGASFRATKMRVKGGGKVDHVGGMAADLWRLQSVPSAAIHRLKVKPMDGGMDVSSGRVSAGPQGGNGGRHEHPGGFPDVRVAPGHGAQDGRLLRAAGLPKA